MYASDYCYATNSYGTSCSSNWLTDTSNDTWTMTRYGTDGDNYLAWPVYSHGGIGYSRVNVAFAVHPGFFLNPDVLITNADTADGSSGNPYILG